MLGAMNAASSLNLAHTHPWAETAAGTAGKAHRFEAGGKLVTEKEAGPLIIWAGSGGRKNTRAGFERFSLAAHGRVRPSVRWKTGRKKIKHQKLRACWFVYKSQSSIWINAELKLLVSKIMTPWNPKGLERPSMADLVEPSRPRVFKPNKINKPISVCLISIEDAILRAFGEDEDEPGCNWGIDEAISHIKEIKRIGFNLQLIFDFDNAKSNSISSNLLFLRYALAKKDHVAARLFVWRHAKTRVTLNQALRHLRAAAYRAFLARRVKPVSRRTRPRRPLYARPRPPSCPLAPPVI